MAGRFLQAEKGTDDRSENAIETRRLVEGAVFARAKR
jgi:hypothetical protein